MKTKQFVLCMLFFVTLWQCKKEAPPTVSITTLPATVDYGSTANCRLVINECQFMHS